MKERAAQRLGWVYTRRYQCSRLAKAAEGTGRKEERGGGEGSSTSDSVLGSTKGEGGG